MSAEPKSEAFALSADARCAQLERQLARERQIRHQTETIAEAGLREVYLANQRFELLCNIANAANQSISTLDALRHAIAEIVAANGWAFANVLLRQGGESDARLEACGIWHARNPDKMFAFAERSSQIVVWPCASTPGRVLIDRTSAWTRDLQAVSGFGRSAEAKRCNLRSSISVPVLQGDEVVAAMEFFAHDANEPEPQLLETLNQIGIQIGRVFKRLANAEKLTRNALYDPLTDLPNRVLFEERLDEIFSRHLAAGALRTSLIYIDLDGFKLVNDALGHLAGDRLLVEMADRLRRVVEAYATTPFVGAPDSVLIARIGGDEFTILVEGEDHCQIAADIAAEIHTCLRPSYLIEGNDVRCAASIGIAHDDGHYAVAADLMRDADVAMYDAKAQGNGLTVIFDQTMRDKAVARLKLEADLRNALKAGDFCLHYQPIIDLAEGRVVGFEALLRWRFGDELIQPNEFLPVAEQSGLMNVLGSWVFREACSTAASWRRSNPDLPAFFMSINVAPCQFLQPSFVEHVQDIICATNIDPSAIVIELTENAAINNRERTARVLEALRAMGIRLSLDDFGTGYSSFSHLQTLPFDTIKIDRSFFIDEHSRVSWSIVDAMLSIGRAMKMRVIAEGIETQAQLDHLAEIGCSFGQGFLFGEAMTPDAALEILHMPPDYPRAGAEVFTACI